MTGSQTVSHVECPPRWTLAGDRLGQQQQDSSCTYLYQNNVIKPIKTSAYQQNHSNKSYKARKTNLKPHVTSVLISKGSRKAHKRDHYQSPHVSDTGLM